MKDKSLDRGKLKIIFLIVDRKRHYEGVARSFLNFAKGMKEKHDVSFVLFRCGSEVIDYLNKNFNLPVIATTNHKELFTGLTKLNPQFVMGDDSPLGLRLLNVIRKKLKITTVVYVQILYGSHAICRCFHLDYLPLRERIIYTLSEFVPFSLLAKRYVAKLTNCDLIIANSKATATLLQTIYGKDVHGIVHPPVDTKIFKPFHSKKSDDVVLYLGSHGGDTQVSFVEAIVKNILQNDFTLNLFGNSKIALAIKRKHPQTVYHESLEDADLADLYSKSIVTICPQRWEMFGYVQVESMACGTPVLAFDCMGPGETIMNRKTGWIAKNKQEFLKMLDFVLENKEIQLTQDFIRRHVEENFSINASVKKLEKVVRVTVDG